MKNLNYLLVLCWGFLLFGVTSNSYGQFPQLGNDIDGESIGDASGFSVNLSTDGQTVAIGAPDNQDGGTRAGHVRVFTWDGLSWVQKGNDIDGSSSGSVSGCAVSLSGDGNTIIIGGYFNSDNGVNSGQVRVFQWNGSSWVQKGSDFNGQSPSDYFGYSVDISIDGNTIAMGARDNNGNGYDSGQVQIFEWNGNTWIQKGLNIYGDANDKLGWSLSLTPDGNTIAIGAPWGGTKGLVSIYSWNGTTWIQKGNNIVGENWQDDFGYSVSISADGNTFAAGDTRNSDNGNYSGSVRVFSWNGNAWVQKGRDLDGEGEYDASGRSISLSNNGEILAIGARQNDGNTGNNNDNRGHVRIFTWTGLEWIQVGDDIDGEAPGDQVENTSLQNGTFVNLNPNGKYIAIGAPGNSANFGLGSKAGHVRVFGLRGIYGYIYNDFNQNCALDTNEVGLANRLLQINPGNIMVQTNNKGSWFLDSLNPGTYTVTLDPSHPNWSLTCSPIQSFTIVTSDTLLAAPVFGMIANYPCSAPTISIHTPIMRPGFSNQNILVQTCNNYHASGILQNAYVIIELDSLITIDTATIPYLSLGNNQYQVNIGDMYPGQCTNFSLSTTLSTNAILGQTLCISSSLFPIDSCVLDSIPNYNIGIPCTTPYDWSHLIIRPKCNNDTIQFTIINTGDGDMTCWSQVRLLIDGVLVLTDSVMLASGQNKVFSFLGDGRTWRMEVDQHPLHPGNSQPSQTIELCGNPSNWNSGFVNILPQNDGDPIVDIHCTEVRGSYDPNDKTGFPLGVDSSHNIFSNQKLEYLIRFQNTGTDTAFNIVVRDTLSTDFDIFSVESGVSSHNYTFRIYGSRILEWSFPNIMLPDSNVNEPLSHGFLKFEVEQQSNLPVGTIIENKAAIYFDFNTPIITNTSWHTIDTNIYQTGILAQQILRDTACQNLNINNYLYTQSGVYYQPTTDSLYILNVIVDTINTSIFQDNMMLVSSQKMGSNTTYQWLDCDNSNLPINGATNRMFPPLNDGNYAVELTNGTCTGTSDCFNYTAVNVNQLQEEIEISIYPNPTRNEVYIQQQGVNQNLYIRILDQLGRELRSSSSSNNLITLELDHLPSGVYIVIIQKGNTVISQKLMKQ